MFEHLKKELAKEYKEERRSRSRGKGKRGAGLNKRNEVVINDR